MEAEKAPVEKDVYHLPKHLKKAGELLLKAASGERCLFRTATAGGHVVEDFNDEFVVALRQLGKNFEKLLKAHSKIVDEINEGTPKGLRKAIGRLDGVMANLIDTYTLSMSFEVMDETSQEIEQRGIEMLRSTVAEMIKSEIKYKKMLGQNLVGMDDKINNNPDLLVGNRYSLTIDSDRTTSLNKLRGLILWYKRFCDCFDSRPEVLEPCEEKIYPSRSVDPIDTAVLGFVIGSRFG